ncbi:UDP-3-O-[3-hydroxymyristoyl] N-acetylglucosamine deacetylase [Merismopedia glauca CCAP 1448/3]|uniref:UDP-3-O-acyl-N-acetylglucosamine deacetylase n=2 Tax=Merismopedia TaxID=53402 RepID=A0A2T1C671_9CYAN|nr:UDP-3-O-acyl-N-acetylglucosamine deacetylase [Merismopedia glauca]PSB03775.1 UDP-3-O-[3-hydroxymyristoyl] N-acetylglucosamine deacetylase [Merismopedia glauca CCAP 1448/3]
MRSPSRIDSPVALSGIGLHSGIRTSVRILPAPPQSGRYFVRTDLPNNPIIPAQIASVSETTLSTQLTCAGASVRTVEHLLAALVGLGIEDARIEIDGSEVPLMDGSARPWIEFISESGLISEVADQSLTPAVLSIEQEASARKPMTQCPIPVKSISEPIWVRQGDAFVAALPAPTIRYTYGIDFDLAPIGKQWSTFKPETESFAQEIAPARTFGLAHQIEALRSAGLIKGGSLDNALVCDSDGWLNPPLRFPDEPVRHKLLDLIGDLSLVGTIPQAHYIAYKASHHLHIQLAQTIAQLM